MKIIVCNYLIPIPSFTRQKNTYVPGTFFIQYNSSMMTCNWAAAPISLAVIFPC